MAGRTLCGTGYAVETVSPIGWSTCSASCSTCTGLRRAWPKLDNSDHDWALPGGLDAFGSEAYAPARAGLKVWSQPGPARPPQLKGRSVSPRNCGGSDGDDRLDGHATSSMQAPLIPSEGGEG
jgi:hypothetical protein